MPRIVGIGLFFGLIASVFLCVGGAFTLRDNPWRSLYSVVPPSGEAATNENGPARVGDPAPDFALRTPPGDTIRLSSLRGTAVVLNFWASWCEPCKSEMPALQTVANRHDGKVRVLAINEQESAEIAAGYARENNLTFTILLDSRGQVGEVYRVRGIPTTYFIDSGGVTRYLSSGALNESAFERRIKELLEYP